MSFNSSSSSIYQLMQVCFKTTVGALSVITFTIINILLILPLCIFVLYLGKQRWQKRVKMSNSDFVTYHVTVIELISVLGAIVNCLGTYTNHLLMIGAASFLTSFSFTAQMILQVLTCLDRYLAVVHPITYLRLKTTRWIRARNIIGGCVWLFCCAELGFVYVVDETAVFIWIFGYLSMAIIIIIFCNLSVLCTLIRPGPGEGGGDRKRPNQSKQRAFYTITVILGALLLRFVGDLLSAVSYASVKMEEDIMCVVWLSGVWFCLPSTLVLPLLLLQRAGKLVCCKTQGETH